jgi:ferric-dicitrate binding protein FerR (iron transport regulator)
MEENKDNRIDELLFRYLAGTVSAGEQSEAETWIGFSEENSQYFNKIRNIWESSSNLKVYEQIDTESSLKDVKKRVNFKQNGKPRIRPLWIAFQVAAVLIISFGIYVIFRQNDNVTKELRFSKIETGNTKRTFVLPDSTVVALNRNSHIEFSENFNKKERKLKFEGEAYFEIKPDKSRPFIIETSRSETKVLGTAFNLKAYPGSETESIVVTHGLVEFSKKSNNKIQKIQLKKGEMAVLSDELKKELNPDLNFLSWKTGIFTFNNEPLPNALKLLSDYYQIEFRIGDDKLKSYTISGKYQNLELKDLIEVLKMTLGIKLEKTGGQYILNP